MTEQSFLTTLLNDFFLNAWGKLLDELGSEMLKLPDFHEPNLLPAGHTWHFFQSNQIHSKVKLRQGLWEWKM